MCTCTRSLTSAGALIAALATLLSGPVLAQSEVVKQVLNNGVTVLVKENHATPVVTIRVYVRAGSIYEGEYLGSGISHFVEHTVSKGTNTRSEKDIDQAVEEIGNSSNAYTTLDHTCYYITTASQYFDRALDVLSDYIINPTFPEEDVQGQKGVILREIIMGEDDPGRVLSKTFYSLRYLRHPARYPVIGYRQQFERLTRDDLVKYHQRLYVPDNIVVAVAGDVSAPEAIIKLQAAFGKMERRTPPQASLDAEPPVVGPRSQIVEKPVNTAYLTMGFPSVSLTDPDLYPLDVLAVVLGRGASSRLYRRLREKEELVTGVSAYSVTPSYGPGHFQILATLPPEKQAAAQAVILEELENIKSTAPAAEELEKAKRVLASDHVFTQETIEGQAAQIGTDDLLTGDPDFSQRYIERIQRVTLEDVRRVARQYLNPDVLCLVAVRPPVPEKTEAVAAPEKSEISRSTLDNGIVLLLRENHAAPTVTMIAAFTGGVRFETDQTNGLSSLTADLLVKGTKKRSAAQIAEAVDSLGARLTPISGKNSIGCALEVLSQDFDAGLNLLNEVLTEPTFPEEEVAKEKRLALSSLAERKDSPFFIASRLLQENYFTGHPYRLDPLGNETSLPTLTRDDIVRFHDQHCVPGKMVLAIFGDFDAEAARSKVAQAFASLPPAKPVEVSLPPQEPPASTQEIVRQKEGIEQAVIYVGLPGGTLGDDDVYAVDVLDAVLSGVSIPGGRLHNRLRGSGAQLVYAVHAYNSPGLEPGMFVIYAATEPSLKDKVLSAIREEVERMRTEEVPADELERGKMMCISSYQISRQANAGQAQSAAYDELYDLGYDRSLHYPERIEQVTPQQVLLAAQRHLDLLHAVIVEVIPAAKQ